MCPVVLPGEAVIAGTPRLYADVLLAAVMLGLAPLAKKAALTAGAPPLALAYSATLVAALVASLPLASRRGREAVAAFRSRTWVHVALVGALGSGAVALLAVLAMTGTTATNRSLFQSMYPVATAVAARLLLGERLRPRAYAVIVAMCIGLFMMNTGPDGLVVGVPFLLLAATLPMIGLADVYTKRTLDDTDPRFVAAGRLVFGALLLSLVLPATDAAAWRDAALAWPWVLAAGVAMAGGVLGLYRAMETAGASLAAAFAGLAPVVTAIGEWWLLGAAFTPLQLAGLVVVVAGGTLLAGRG